MPAVTRHQRAQNALADATIGDTQAVHDIVYINNIFKRNAYMDQGGPNCGYWRAITSFS